MKGYKVFNPDWTCKGFQYKVGQTYELEGDPVCCECGFHFCIELKDCFKYYDDFSPNNKVAVIEARGAISTDGNRSCTNKITIVKEITWEDVLRLVNIGKSCSGFRNSGDYNSGNCNSGDWNKTYFSSGVFNTKEEKIMMFNKPSNWTYRDWANSEARCILNQIGSYLFKWVYSSDMTDKEKEEHPGHKITGSYLKKLDESKSAQKWWDTLSNNDKKIITSLPNFDAKIFEEITGIKINEIEEDYK